MVNIDAIATLITITRAILRVFCAVFDFQYDDITTTRLMPLFALHYATALLDYLRADYRFRCRWRLSARHITYVAAPFVAAADS